MGVAKLVESRVDATAGNEKEDDSIVSDGGPVVAEVAPVSVSGDRGDFSPSYVADGPSSLRFLGSTETYDVCILDEQNENDKLLECDLQPMIKVKTLET